ncbi:MAG: hypothetical protein A2Z28_01635 [Chloroflexi bacterium RBG_16_51_9]|nr:MAG: hypothetical protein A2Z28_01635 [Chloroflexi bacterium RBG_16_51_9]
MPTSRVNLDALIKREEFAVISTDQHTYPTNPQTLQISELEPDRVWHQLLRKPDFQRETANWDSGRVAELIESFAKGDLIPALIFWKANSGNLFVIDGAHRLSALIAWVLDDYGDKEISLNFFQNYIPLEQVKSAERTRKLVKESVGSYQELKAALRNPDNSSAERVQLAKNVFGIAIQLQWVVGDSATAEKSYFKINRQAVTIDPTELSIIESRRKPNALATRALIRAGTGHKYWSAFPDKIQKDIEKTAREIYDTLFKPQIETPLRTLDIPIAGRGYSGESVKMVFDFVNLVNNVSPVMWQNKTTAKSKKKSGVVTPRVLPDDQDGLQTLQYLREVRKVATRIGSNDPSSLGLHPIVYFYGATGRFLPMTFLAVVAFVKDLESNVSFAKFTRVRSQFEDFLLEHRAFVNQIGHEVIGGEKRVQTTILMYQILFEGLTRGDSVEQIIGQMKSHTELKFLRETTTEDKEYGKDFSTETKSTVYLREAIDKSLRCTICNARLHFKSISFDHKDRKEDGGLGIPDNAQLTHPYCNTGYKEMLNAKGINV